MKRAGVGRPLDGFRPIHMPSNTGAGVVLAGISTLLGFALIWHIWWLVGISFVALLVSAIAHTFNYKRDYHIPAEDVAAVEAQRTAQLERLAQTQEPPHERCDPSSTYRLLFLPR
jgi:cytochrome o ubiquinol oxidase subunit 1